MIQSTPTPVKTVNVPVEELTIHPSIKGMARLAQDDPRYDIMRTTWQESGFIPPIWVTEDHQIINGRHRYWYAKANKIPELAAVVVPADQVPLFILSGISGQNHNTKGQRAYFAVPFMESAFDAASKRRLGNLTGAGGRSALPPCPTVEDLANRLGVDRDTLFKAKKLHKLFEAKPHLKEEWEPRLLDPEAPLGLGAALSGIAGKESTEGKPRPATRNTALHNYCVAWTNLGKACGRGWTKWTGQEKAEARAAMGQVLSSLPDEAIHDLQKELKATIKGRKRDLTSAQ